MSIVGIGQDSHPFEKAKNKPLILAGIKISDNGGLQGNSDGDVIIHSLCNALSSALGGDSIGTWSDDMCLKQGVKESTKYLEYIFNIVKNKNFILENISITVEAKTPRLSIDTIKKIKERLTMLLDINLDQVGITFTSGEGLTAFGRGEAIQVFSIVSLLKRKE
jgi:2-C-methyl-D-erythritol 2,4-cyclodiphosphate synthase